MPDKVENIGLQGITYYSYDIVSDEKIKELLKAI
jgi:hypothetical protein